MSENLLSKLRFGFGKELTLVLQTEISECGLACLAMIARYHGHDTNLAALRQRYPVSSRGMNLQQIAYLGTVLKLDYTGCRLELDEMDQLTLPCILHWDLNHFVVLKKVTKKGIVIHDPAIGVRNLSWDEVSGSFTGVALQFYPQADFQPIKEKKTISLYEFWRSLQGVRKSLMILFVLTLVLQFWSLLNPLLMRFIVDDVLIYQDTSLLKSLCIGFGLMTVMSTATSVLRSMFLLFLTKILSLQVQNALFGRLIRLPLPYFIKRQTGDIMARFSSLQSIQSLVTTTFVESTLDGLMVLISLSMMMIYAPMLSLITIIALLGYIALRAATITTFKEMNEEMIAANSKERSVFLETLHSIQPIKIFNKEQERQSLWQTRLTDAFNVSIRTEQYTTVYAVANKMIFALENILILYFASLMIINRSGFSLGMMYAFLQYKGQFSGSVSSLVDNFYQLKMVDLHLERIADIALEKPDRAFEDDDLQKTKKELDGQLSAENISFRYDMFDPPLFEKVSFQIAQGESVAFIGPSGCGKSTLMKILIGLLEVEEGTVRVDNQNISDLALGHYRNEIACVMQNDMLLAGSIRQNIAFFDEQIDDELVQKCAKLAQIHDDIMKMTSQYETMVGELGSQISGGQQQRILIARALYKKPKILFLDEATSHLDIQTEVLVSSAISELKITRVLIAHRPETIKTADRLLLLKDGKVQEVGPEAIFGDES